ncbi:MAG: ATP-binding protein [Oscillospiraceae bacterium]|nr:ATP-binding protein [Oscillospiraceae bacterium]MDD6526705.1 ATP-binding protein [Oscillospiraceae bacterium]
MAYKKSVYEKAAQRLEARRKKAEDEQKMRRNAAALKCPELLSVEREMADCAVQAVKAIGLGDDAEKHVLKISEKSLQAQQKRKELLKSAGLPEDYLEAKYTCPVCHDTGFHDGYYCDCYKKLIKQTAVDELGISAQIKKCTFDSFRLDCYPNVVDPVLGISQKEQMKTVYEYCCDWAKDFSRRSTGLIMLGKTGLGKTHLSLAILGVVINKGYSVYYNSVQNIMDRLQKEHFGKTTYNEDSIEGDLYESDLLILDDLGAEFSTQFTVAELYNILNTRMINSKPIIISTNLTVREIEEKYSQRIASRIVGSCMPLQFCGRDIRQILNG